MSKEAFKKAIQTTEGPCVILAGAGTGKTTCMVEKVKYLVQQKKCQPEEIVCLTFSNEAARELTRRIHSSLDEGDLKKGGPMVRTFHGFSSEVLQESGRQIKVLTPDEGKVVLHRYLRVPLKLCHQYVQALGTAKDLGLKLRDLEAWVKKEVERRGLQGKEGLQGALELKEFELHTLGKEKDRNRKKELTEDVGVLKLLLAQWKFCAAWAAYEKLKEKQGYVDYADLHHEFLRLFEGGYKGPWKQVIVDEFQDTNRVQLDLIFGLAPGLATTSGGDSQVETVVGALGTSSPAPPTVGAEGITVVGDLNQSIYRFRGAYQENLKLFREHFNVPPEGVFNLDASYRCPNTVLRAAHRLITKNYEKKEESFLVENAVGREGDKIAVWEMQNGKEEARKVVELVKESLAEGVPAEEIAVLFRTHQQGQVFRRALTQAKIGFVAVAQRSLLDDELVKQVRDYLTIVSLLRSGSSGGEQVWWDVVYRLGFPEKDVIRIGKLLRGERGERGEQIESSCLSEDLLETLGQLPLSSSGRMLAQLLVKRLKELRVFEYTTLGELIEETYRICGFIQDDEEGKEGMLPLTAFHELAQHHENLYGSVLGSFLQYLDIMSELGVRLDVPGVEEAGVRVMTLHSTKGLEFERVILTNMAQKRFPSERWSQASLLPPELLPQLAGKLPADVEEKEVFIKEYEQAQNLKDERRLAYVAMTRTKGKLLMTYAKEYGSRKHGPSKFLEELEIKADGSSEFIFETDVDEKWEEPVAESSFSFGRILRSGDPEVLLASLVQQGSSEKIRVQEKKTLSPSSLRLFTECQKRFEYKYVYHMPEPKSLHWEAMQLGSFVHKVLEGGVQAGFGDVIHFLDLARQKVLEDEWSSVELSEAEGMIKVFFSRSGEKLKGLKEVKTEQHLKMQLAGLSFMGYADRIDFHKDGSVEIVDYKTGGGSVSPKARDWQLGYYALAAEASGLGKVRRVVLDMLRQVKPLSFLIGDDGWAVEEVDGRMKFNVYEVEEELVETARDIGLAYKNGFEACEAGSCGFCDEWVYGEG